LLTDLYRAGERPFAPVFTLKMFSVAST